MSYFYEYRVYLFRSGFWLSVAVVFFLLISTNDSNSSLQYVNSCEQEQKLWLQWTEWYDSLINLMFSWPCIMNWLHINYQLDVLIITYS